MLSRVPEDKVASLRVLVVEPYAQIREIIHDILTRAIGVGEVLEAKNGDVAMTILRDTPCDVVIADANMDPCNAIALTKRIRTGEGNIDPHLPVIVTSGRAELGEIIAARDAGANEYLAKPLSAKILALRLHMVIEHPRPFVRASHFYGPDRRRHADGVFAGAERRHATPDTENGARLGDAANRSPGASAAAS